MPAEKLVELMAIDDARFLHAVNIVLDHESGARAGDAGGLIPYDKTDPGGATNYWGVSLRFLAKAGTIDADGDGWMDGDLDHDGDIDADDIAMMSRQQAIELYHRQWWIRYGYGDLILGVSAKVFDLAVNMGAGQAHRLLQRAVWAADGEITIADDGVLGPMTRQAIARHSNRPERIVAPMRSEAAGFYRRLMIKNPDFNKYSAGWLRRAYS